VANRAIFNRNYSSYQADGTTVYLANGQGVVTNPAPEATMTAGAALIAGEVVCASGNFAVPALAYSGVQNFQLRPIGIATAAATNGSDVTVNLDGVATLSDANITAQTALSPGEYYFLSKYLGQVVKYETASGIIAGSGAWAYEASSPIGLALSATALSVQIQPPTFLYTGG